MAEATDNILEARAAKVGVQQVSMSVIVPTYNEAKNLPELVNRLETSLKSVKFEVVVVDDNSPDGTADVADKLNEKYTNLKILRRTGKLGLSSAVVEGFSKTVPESQCLAVMDADMQHPPELLAQMLNKIQEGCDVVVASRYVAGGSAAGLNAFRLIISICATTIAHIIMPKTRVLKDVMSGFFMVKRTVVECASLDPIGYKILFEILAKGNYQIVSEVPYIFEPRKNGDSNLNFKEIWNFLIQVRRLMAHNGDVLYENCNGNIHIST